VKHLFLAVLLTGLLTGCTQQPPKSADELRKETADATARLKTNTKAVVEGIREGLARDEKVDVNSASKAKLMLLPGVDAAAADRIIANRPYSRPEDLVERRVISQAEYEQIKDHLEVKK